MRWTTLTLLLGLLLVAVTSPVTAANGVVMISDGVEVGGSPADFDDLVARSGDGTSGDLKKRDFLDLTHYDRGFEILAGTMDGVKESIEEEHSFPPADEGAVRREEVEEPDA